MKINSLLLLGALSIAITSCNNGGNNKTSESGTEKEEVKTEEQPYNESIQNVFFGVPFGATYEEACEKLSQDFWFNKRVTTKDRLSLNPKKGGKISFGGRSWDLLDMGFSNNRFYTIQLHNTHKTKESAMSEYNSLYSVISRKYNMKTVQESDTTTYGLAYGITKTNQQVWVQCHSYESVSHERWIGVSLIYADQNFEGISEEL
ncbi:MAG: hypothetical protein J6Y22_05985 [Paludibacteraceae bacterium]|nr:hypothetical protein [Paludibacteraceae bacterium]